MAHFNITFEPDGRQISIHAGATLLEAAGQAGIILNTVCGGKGTCGKCAVMLPDGSQVLACQYKVDGDLAVSVPAASRFFEHKILSEGVAVRPQFQRDIYKKHKKLAGTDNILGLALDIGTTTVVAKLINMLDGRSLATEARLNPQTRYGDDVITRISYAHTEQNLTRLQKAVIECVNELVEVLCRKAKVTSKDIYELAAVGNTTMNHLFLSLPVAQLGQAPYRAYSLDAHNVPAAKLGLNINPKANVHTVENIAGFVGSDTTAAALAVAINEVDDATVLVDIGTNGEVVLAAKDKLYAASCAAGPALEGARISQGSRAAEGAIEAVVVNQNDIDLDVIGNLPPTSICGSGLIDAVAVLLDLGVIDGTGRFANPDALSDEVSSAILRRIVEKHGQPAFVLAFDENTGAPAVTLTQKDVREVQLAKAAIRAGIRLLQKRIGLFDDDIKTILLAGAFGNYIRKTSAVRIGLLPDVPLERIHFVGNAACSGAQMILLNSRARTLAQELARKIEYVEIAHDPNFQDTYADLMHF